MTEFGGEHEYVRVWSFGPAGVSKSFPSGHAGMGFYLMAPAFVLYRRHRRWALGFLLLGLTGGGILGLARIVQGQHFPSDVLWSAGLVYLLGLILSYLYHVIGSAAPLDRQGRVRPRILRMEQEGDEERSSQGQQDGTRRRAA
jgi:membrane-associated PAP2 superfamily phosphatase